MRNLGSYLNNLVLGGGGLILHFVKFLDHRLLLTFCSISDYSYYSIVLDWDGTVSWGDSGVKERDLTPDS